MNNELLPAVQAFSADLAARADDIRGLLPATLSDAQFRAAVINCFRNNADLQACSAPSIMESVLAAAACGLVPINGHGYLIPYKGRCGFVPGWKGLVHLVVESGKAIVSANVAQVGDQFSARLGTSSQIDHLPMDPADEEAWLLAQQPPLRVRPITHAYAVGRIKGFESCPIVECWPLKKLLAHRDRYNKQGAKHYSFREEEMYFRKVVLLQVLKVLPKSPQLQNAMAVNLAAETGAGLVIDGGVVQVEGEDDYIDEETSASAPVQRAQPLSKSQGSARPSAAARPDPDTGELVEPRAASLRPPAPPAPAPDSRPRVSGLGLKWLQRAIAEGSLSERWLLGEYRVNTIKDLAHEDVLALRNQVEARAA